MPTRITFSSLALALAVWGTAAAQDTRTVVEPHYPKTCTVLHARLAAPGGELSVADEHNPDTTQLHSAIDNCPAGEAVELRAEGGKNIFLSGPLYLKAGVTLVVSANTALFASRDSRDYDLTPGSCGILTAKGHSCKPLITAENAVATSPEAAVKVLPEDKTLYVAADGTGDYWSIQRAIDVAPATGGALILVAPGTYREVLTIDKPNIQLRSANADASKTVVVFDRSAALNGGTFKTATVNVTGDDFYAENITFQNDFKVTKDPNITGSQAVALRVLGDRAIFHNVRLLALQDTLYAASKGCTGEGANRTCRPARQYFSDCYIEGHFDFIFGDGKAVFDRCEIHSKPLSEGFITAQSKIYPQQDSGYVIYKSRLTADPGVTNVWLGRPWRPYSTVTYIETEMGAHIRPEGWREWLPGTHSIETSTYAEFGSTGPGAHKGERDPHGKQLRAEEAKHYAPEEYLRGDDNWNPVTQKAPAVQ